MVDYATPTKFDLDRSLSTIMHGAHHKAQAERGRLTSEFTARGMALSTPLISAVVGTLDNLHKEALERASATLRDFAERMPMSPPEIAGIARYHLQNLGNTVLGQLPPAGFPQEQQRVRNQYRAVFEQRLDGMLRDFEIGFANGRNQVSVATTPSNPSSAPVRPPMTDAEIRYRLLTVFYARRHNSMGWVPTSDIDLSPDAVDPLVIAGVCQQLADLGLIQWKPARSGSGFIVGMAKITGKGVAAVEAKHCAEIDIRFPIENPPAAGLPSSPDDALSDAALEELRQAIAEIKSQLPTVSASNAVRTDIESDVAQIHAELDRPAPRRKFLRICFESLRDNLAKAAGAGAAGLITTIGLILAKHFGFL